MSPNGSRPAAVGFHSGELAVQQHAGVTTEAARLAPMVGPGELRTGIAGFLAGAEFAVVTGHDRAGRLWTSPLWGPRGFMGARGPGELVIGAQFPAPDPLHLLPAGQSVGVIVIDFVARRRFRVNGVLTRSDDVRLTIAVEQAYGNCPRYIRPRRVMATGSGRQHPSRALQYRGELLRENDIRLITEADTMFLGTTHPDAGNDASHRGGPAGFVRVTSGGLWWPDYPGNNMFNSLGNLAVDPAAALLFVDFGSGDTLQLSGDARVGWDFSVGDVDGGTGRRVLFVPRSVVATGVPGRSAHECRLEP